MIGAAYRAVQGRVVEVAFGAADAEQRVPACPAWSVTDVVRHVTGIAADIVAGNLDGWATDAWTAAQVDARAGRSLGEVVDEWDELLDRVIAILDGPDRAEDSARSAVGSVPVSLVSKAALNDLVQHEFDLRNATGDAGGRSDPVVHEVAAGYVRGLRPVFAAADLPTLRVESTDLGRGWNIGRDEPVAVLRATSFELMRTIGGRRTESEVASLGWDGDGSSFLEQIVFPVNSPAEQSLGERG